MQAAIDAITLKKPSRVPVNLFLGVYPARWAGVTIRDAMYDCERFAPLWGRFHEEFGLDFVEWPVEPGRPMELLGAKYVVWPGHGLADDAPWQYTSEENMLPDEYEMLIDDPSDYWLRVYLPRVVEAFEPLAGLYPFTQMYQANKLVARLTPLADKHVGAALRSLTAAAESYVKYTETYSAVSRDLTARCGLPEFMGSSLFAPYDILADTLRGTKGIVLDRFRCPEKIEVAAARLVRGLVEATVRDLGAAVCPLVFLPLHKGADDWMSEADYRRFYWPTLKAVLMELVDQGAVPVLFAEGSYNRRLSVIVDEDLPAGSLVWWFDQVDMAKAKQALRQYACIAGNVPSDVLTLGEAHETALLTQRLLDEVAQDGGFILGNGAILNEAKPDNLKAMIDVAHRWGAA